MSFAWDISIKNIKRKPFRSVMMGLISMLLSITVFLGSFAVISLKRGLEGYKARLGSDIVVIPSSAKGHGSVDDIYLQGITGNYYMPQNIIDKVSAINGIETVSRQFFLTSAKASCCSQRVQITGFDPDTDISVLPWIKDEYNGSIGEDDIIIGSEVSMPDNGILKFYGRNYNVKAQLDRTGTGLDNGVYANMSTVRRMAESASGLSASPSFDGVDINTAASALFIKVKEGYDIDEVSDDINIHITKVQAQTAKSMVSHISDGLEGISGMIGILAVVIWILSVVLLIVVFALLSNERKKEFGVLRVMGASNRMLSGIMSIEAAIISLCGAVTGLGISFVPIAEFSGGMREKLELPFLSPEPLTILLLCLGTLIISGTASVLTAFFTARRIAARETGLLLREET